jgi:hypothetical protein
MAASVLSLLHFWFVAFFCCVAASRAREQVYACGLEVESAGNQICRLQDRWEAAPLFNALKTVFEVR